MKTTPILQVAALLIAPLLHAQVFNPPPQPRPNPNAPASTTIVNRNEAPQQRPMLGGDLPVLDPTTEVAVWDGQAFNMNESRLNAQFETYLAAPASDTEEDQEYYKIMREIMDLLRPTNRSRENYGRAISLLPHASSFPQDGDQSNTLLNAVYRVYLSQRRQADMDRMITNLRKREEELTWRGDHKAGEGTALNAGAAPAGGGGRNQSNRGNQANRPDRRQTAPGGANPNQNTGQGTASLAYQSIVNELMENQATVKSNQAAIKVSEIASKTEFQFLLAQMFLQRRFEHTLIGCAFYVHLFSDGEGTLKIDKDSDIGRLFSEGFGGSPTISSLEAAARDAINKVDANVQAFQSHIALNELWAAYKRLQEAYAVGEFLPSVRVVPTEQKRRLINFSRTMFQLTNAIQVKDYTKAQELVDNLRGVAIDFDSTKHQAAINISMTVSDMHLGKAAILQGEGRIDEAQDEIRKAMELWPTNPKIREQVAPSFEALTMKGRATQDFDRLISERNYRAIFREKEKYAAALFDDESRRDSLNQIVGNLIKIDTAIAQSRELEARDIPGAVYTAWEEIQTLVSEFGDDADLRIRAEELSSRASDFVSALNRAEQLQRAGNTGSAMAWLLKAREIYPDSKRARQGIASILDSTLPMDRGFGDHQARESLPDRPTTTSVSNDPFN